MAIIRQTNLLGQMRIDVPHLRSIESAIANDFDILAGKALSGRQPVILRGFTIPVTNTIGNSAENLQLTVAAGLLMHFGATESGTIFSVSDSATAESLTSTNAKVVGSFTANSTNYIGLDLIRSADATTSDLVQFLDANTLNGVGQTVPLARTLQYKIVISTQNFTVSSNIIPIAKVVTSSTNTVVSITDSRKMMFRLGSGGDTPNALATYSWGTRVENGITFTGSNDPFVGEDKSINNLKSWMDAIMASIWEVKGGEHWYSNTNRDNVKLCFGPLSSLADNFTYSSNILRWEGLSLAFENADASGVYVNTIADNTSGVSFATNGLCLYVDLTRESNATNIPATVVALESINATPSTIPGRRIILAWRIGGQVFVRERNYEIGRAAVVATTTTDGVVRLNNTPGTPLHPVVTSIMSNGQIEVTASGGNSYAILGTGNGTGEGIRGIGGSSNGTGAIGLGTGTGTGGRFDSGSGATGIGVHGRALATNGYGVKGEGAGNLAGIYGLSGLTNDSYGVIGEGLATNSNGVYGLGKGTGSGVVGDGGSSSGTGGNFNGGTVNGTGVISQGLGSGIGIWGLSSQISGTGTGVVGWGGINGGNGVEGFGKGGNSIGVYGKGNGTGNGVQGEATTSGSSYGVYGLGGSSGGGGVYGISTNSSIGTYGGYFEHTGSDAIGANGSIRFLGSNNDGYPNTGAGGSTINRLFPNNLIKSYLSCPTGTASPTPYEAFAIFSIACSATTVTVTLSHAMTNTRFQAVIQMESSGGSEVLVAYNLFRTASGGSGGRATISFQVYNIIGSQPTLNVDNVPFSLIVTGDQ